jgi:signal transduction histidine kinase
MFDYVQKLLGASGLAPHGFCLLWDPALIWTHVVADALIGLAYFSIPVVIAVFVARRPDLQFKWAAWLFAIFILSCGTTHFFSIWTLWNPDYGPEALVKLVTAAVSVLTAVVLWPLLPRVLALPSPGELQLANADLRLRIAERDAALAALAAETAERQRAETMLRQAQKMDAVGQLTAGIAHDFNNLLTVIMANVDRAKRLASNDARQVTALEGAIAGAERAAQMTDRLLAYARRQPLQPVVQDLNIIARQMVEILGTMLDPGVAITADLSPALWPVCVDTAQAENAILNLAINARDAMPAGGTLLLTTRNATDAGGDWVVLELSDTGVGMDSETLERVFEPFFTTKALGDGTGLGLSQVYGFVRQSDGEVAIDSMPGAGTTIRIQLPRAS